MNAENAQQAVKYASLNPGSWIGDGKHDEQVCFANGVYTVASNGDGQDFKTAEVAAECLDWQWKKEDERND